MADDQRHGRIFGVLFILTFVTSILAYILFQDILDDPAAYIGEDGKDNVMYLAVLLEFFLIVTNVGTAVVLYPIAKRQNQALAIGYVAARIIESVFIAAGTIFILGVVSLRQDSPDAADLAVSLAALKDWTFLFGPGFTVPLGNGLILGYLMYRSGLVPRRMAWLGMIGGPLLFISSTGDLFEWWETGSTIPGLFVIPEFIWEAFLGIYCAIWGFRKDSPILRPAWRGTTGMMHDPDAQPIFVAAPDGLAACRASCSLCSFSSDGSPAVGMRPTMARRIRTGRPGRMTTSGRAASVRSRCCSQASCFCTSRRRSELRSEMRKQLLAVLRNSLGLRLRVP